MAKHLKASLALILLLSGCAHYPDDRELAYEGRDWAGSPGPSGGELRGPGVEILDRWLSETVEGRAIVTLGFRDAARGYVSEDVGHRANIWFRRYADENRDMKVTDPEIRTALVTAAGRYLR